MLDLHRNANDHHSPLTAEFSNLEKYPAVPNDGLNVS